MAVRFDAAADRLLRTTDLLDFNSTYSWMAWVQIVTDLNAQSTFIALNDNNVNNIDIIRTATNGTQLQLRCSIAGVGTNIAGTDIGVGNWNHIAMVRESQTSLKMYLNGALDGTATDNMTGRTSALRMEHGAIRTTNVQNSDSRVYAIKAWSAALTLAEIQLEQYSIRPRRLSNLYAYWPCRPGATERLKDYSGNGRDWTEAGTLTDEAEPPVTFGNRSGRKIFVLTGTTFNQTVSASASSSVSLIKSAGKIIAVSNTPVFTKTALVNKALSFSSASTLTTVKQTNKVVSVTGSSIASLARNINKIISASVSSSVSIATNLVASTFQSFYRNAASIALSVKNTGTAAIQRITNTISLRGSDDAEL